MRDLQGNSEVCHQLIERCGGGGPHFPGQMRVEGRGAGTAMAQAILNQAQVETRFQQVRGVGMAQRVDMSALVDATLLPGMMKGTLHTTARDGTPLVGQTVRQPMTGGRGKQPERRAMSAPVSPQ